MRQSRSLKTDIFRLLNSIMDLAYFWIQIGLYLDCQIDALCNLYASLNIRKTLYSSLLAHSREQTRAWNGLSAKMAAMYELHVECPRTRAAKIKQIMWHGRQYFCHIGLRHKYNTRTSERLTPQLARCQILSVAIATVRRWYFGI